MVCPSCQTPVMGQTAFCQSCGALLPRQDMPDPLIGRVIAGKYKFVQLVGEGGMGAVYVGEQALGNRTRKVAIKTLHAHLSRDEKIRERFGREVGTLAGLEHPNTVQVYDFGATEDRILYIVMEFVQGKSIADVLEKEGPMQPDRVAHVVSQICGSLAEAHGQGIIHRDLKPDNVILAERAGQKDFVKVLDFGIAKRNQNNPGEKQLTQQGMVLGTPPYMSPEQFTGQALDLRSDIYSLAVMTYEMLTGKLPFDATNAIEWATLHMTAAPRAIEAMPNGAALPESMRSAVMKALSKAPDQRFATINDFLARFSGKSNPAQQKATAAHNTNEQQKKGSTVGLANPPSVLAAPIQSAFQPPPPSAYQAPPQSAYQPPPQSAYQPPPQSAYQPPPQSAFGGGAPGSVPPGGTNLGTPARGSVPPAGAGAPFVAGAVSAVVEPMGPSNGGGAEQKGKTMIGEPLAFDPGASGGGFGNSPAPNAYGPPPGPAPGANYGPPPGAMMGPPPGGPAPGYYGGGAPARESGGGGKGLIVVLLLGAMVLLGGLVAYAAGVFDSGPAPYDAGAAMPTETPTETPTVATTTTPTSTTAPTATPLATNTTAPLNTKPTTTTTTTVRPQPTPTTTPTPRPTTTPTPQPTPTPTPTPRPTPTPQPTPTPTPTPIPTPTPTPTPVPTPTPTGPKADPVVCQRAREARAAGSPMAARLATQCLMAGGQL